MAKKRIAAKIDLKVDVLGGTTYVKLASVKSISDPALTREEVEMTCMDSTFDDYRPSPVLNVGELSLELYWDEADTGHLALVDLVETDPGSDPSSYPTWQLIFNFADGVITKEFAGFLRELGEASYEVKGEVMRTAVLRPTTMIVTA